MSEVKGTSCSVFPRQTGFCVWWSRGITILFRPLLFSSRYVHTLTQPSHTIKLPLDTHNHFNTTKQTPTAPFATLRFPLNISHLCHHSRRECSLCPRSPTSPQLSWAALSVHFHSFEASSRWRRTSSSSPRASPPHLSRLLVRPRPPSWRKQGSSLESTVPIGTTLPLQVPFAPPLNLFSSCRGFV